MVYPDDEILLKGCLRQDPNMQRALYEKYKLPMFRLCLRYCSGRAEAEDVLQEGFIKVFNELKNFRSEGALGGWMRKIILRTALMHLRKQKDWITTVEISEAGQLIHPEAPRYEKLDREVLTKLIQQLPAGYRTIFNMFVIEGFSHREIAAQLSIAESTSKSQLYKAKRCLKAMLEKIITV